MIHSVVLMTALVPTTGHADLISFAENMGRQVSVIVSSRSFEPVSGQDRVDALREHFIGHEGVHIYLHEDDDAPQNSDGSHEFWDYWAGVVRSKVVFRVTHVIASEKYGKEMADALGLKFIPYDIDRQVNNVKGSKIRESFLDLEGILPEFRKYLTRNYVIMGQESVGKTTMTKLLSQSQTLTSGSYPEFARPYIENAHYSENQTDILKITGEMMYNIERGQYYFDKMARESGRFQVNIQDTDLLSTVGYYRIFNSKNENPLSTVLIGFLFHYIRMSNRNTKYFILPDDIPVEEDPLRAAGKERESTYEFWVDLAKEYGVNFVEVPRGSKEDKFEFMLKIIYSDMKEMYEPISKFKRE